MGPSRKRKSLVALTVVALGALLLILQSGLPWLVGGVLPMEGKVLTVGPGAGQSKVATVRLALGPTVNAFIPTACVVFPGQIAIVRFTGPIVGANPAFALWENRDVQ